MRCPGGDKVQEIYDEEDAAKRATTAESADARLGTYLAGIATAIAMGTMVAAPRPNVDSEGRDVTPEDLVGNAELVARVKAIVLRLPDAERTLVERHYFGDETLDQGGSVAGPFEVMGQPAARKGDRDHRSRAETVTTGSEGRS
jgi:RNA polymerase sigma factor for flagellar operon FliA